MTRAFPLPISAPRVVKTTASSLASCSTVKAGGGLGGALGAPDNSVEIDLLPPLDSSASTLDNDVPEPRLVLSGHGDDASKPFLL